MTLLVCAFFVVAELFTGLYCQNVPAPSIAKCRLADSSCLKLTSQKVLPIFISTGHLDPMAVEDVSFHLAGLSAHVNNITVLGLKKSSIDKLTFNTKRKEMMLVTHGDLTIRGKYKAGGRLLILPITGDGDMLLKMKNMRLNVSMNYELIGEKGFERIQLTGYKYVYDVVDHAYFDLTNLFNGNKQLGEVMLNFMNANWKQITEEFGGPLVDAATKEVFKNIRRYLNRQPLGDIAVLDDQ